MTDIRQWMTMESKDQDDPRSYEQIRQEWQAEYSYIESKLRAEDQQQLAAFITWLLTYANSVE